MPEVLPPRPAFCVNEPFQGVVVVQMNQQFSRLLQEFIEEMNNDMRVNSEIWALRRALADPAGSRDSRDAKRYRQQRSGG